MDSQRLKDNFAQVVNEGDAVALFFYSDLFVRNPHLRDMFPIGMSGQRDKLLRALGHIVSQVDDLNALVPFLQQLGRDHRKFGIVAEHYPQVGASLLATLRHFTGDAWTDDMEGDWNAAYTLVAKVMLEAADENASDSPAWWNGRVVAVERRRFDIGVLRIQPDRPLPYLPGRSVAVEVPSRLRHWRYYSMANAPRADHTIDFHVRLVDGGRSAPSWCAAPRSATGCGWALLSERSSWTRSRRATSCWSRAAPVWRRSRRSWSRYPAVPSRRACTCSSAPAPVTACTTWRN